MQEKIVEAKHSIHSIVRLKSDTLKRLDQIKLETHSHTHDDVLKLLIDAYSTLHPSGKFTEGLTNFSLKDGIFH